MPDDIKLQQPDERPTVPDNAHDVIPGKGAWKGPTYYGRSQLKQAPFENWVVGGYIFLAGLSGASALLSVIADATKGKRAEDLVRRGRYLSLLAPTIGSALLIWDLHSPKRFYNMLRIAKRTSPMSIGTWILMTFSGFAMVSAAAQFLADRMPGRRWIGTTARVAQAPAAVAGLGLSTYTASLLSATSTPLWAAAPQGMAVRFGSSAMASGASVLSLGESSPYIRRTLNAIAAIALATEFIATRASNETYRNTGVSEALDGGWGVAERAGGMGVGMALPIALYATSLVAPKRHMGLLSDFAAVAVMAGSLIMRVSIMSAGDVSASRPDISFRFAQPENLPKQRSTRRSKRVRDAGIV